MAFNSNSEKSVIEAYCQQKTLSQWWQNLYVELEEQVTVNQVYKKFSTALCLCFIHRKELYFTELYKKSLILQLSYVLVAIVFSIWNFYLVFSGSRYKSWHLLSYLTERTTQQLCGFHQQVAVYWECWLHCCFQRRVQNASQNCSELVCVRTQIGSFSLEILKCLLTLPPLRSQADLLEKR